ncbi:HEAT repeat [Kriegella aquimaris]|uniref:HEAT repeat n=2 Tax=Kriegella aquimaris TaxID=192904 RepID=A0A1G9R811_9FLAO|nr:HEAT repeat [Kriegella aquimaris]
MGLLVKRSSTTDYLKMKKTIIRISALFLLLCTSNILTGQINRTLETKVADILAQLPTNDLKHSDRLMEEIIGLGTEGILQFSDKLVPLGSGNDTPARYAIESVAIYSGGKTPTITGGVVEEALLKALEKASDKEVKTFLIRRLMHCGSNASVTPLSNYLSDEQLYKPAIATLTNIGTSEAAKAIFNGTKNASGKELPEFIDALGALKYAPSEGALKENASNSNNVVKAKALMALAQIASPDSFETLTKAAAASNYRLDASKSISALSHYANQLAKTGNKALSSQVARLMLKNCSAEDQLHFRSTAVHILRANEGSSFNKTLLKEAKKSDKKYVASVLDAASENLSSEEVEKWIKYYKKASPETKALLIGMLEDRNEASVFEKGVLEAVTDKNKEVRIAGIKALAYQEKDKAFPVLLQALNTATSPEEFTALEQSLLKIVSAEDNQTLADNLDKTNTQGKVVLVDVLAARNATSQYNTITELADNGNEDIKRSVYAALPSISGPNNIVDLTKMLSTATDETNIGNIQKAIISVLEATKGAQGSQIYQAYDQASDKSKLAPVLAALSSDNALELVSQQLKSGNEAEKLAAADALALWKNNAAIPLLFDAAKSATNSAEREKAFTRYLAKVSKSHYPDEQKLLLVRKLMLFAQSISEKKLIIQSASRTKTFLSLIFVSEFLNDSELITTASNAAIRIALPTPGVNNGLSGEVVRDIVSRSVNNLTGQDSQYIKIDVKEFLDKMPKEKGFVSIFNGTDFSGWEGLVENPIARGKMSKSKLAKAQKAANEQMMRDWFIKDGVIGFKGDGYNNICTVKDYGDFEMLVDWKITKGGDSGIYLRGTPQVQIWDIARVDSGAEVGSGGLYNNQKHESKPLTVADNPVDEWNTFHIKMVGDRVTVHLNGVLVTDNVVLENYWDRNLSIFPKEAIELQAHGEDLGFRNVYVREISPEGTSLTESEQKEGFKALFSGEHLDYWIGNKTDYLIENGEIAVRPSQGGHGNLFTAEEFSDFIFRFEFKLTPGANNGLGIHAPLGGDAAYEGKELQILDNTADIYANLKPYQYHGSVYGIIPAKRGFLKPVGEWNTQEVVVKGDDVKVTLNGTVILEGNMKEAAKNGPADHKEHPGLQRNKGHIGFLGHGAELWFRNIRIKNLEKQN